MIEDVPDAHRQLLLVLTMKALSEIRNDPEMAANVRECEAIIKRFSGVDTKVTVERAYPSGVD
jgi:hypothetical protein